MISTSLYFIFRITTYYYKHIINICCYSSCDIKNLRLAFVNAYKNKLELCEARKVSRLQSISYFEKLSLIALSERSEW